MDQCPHCGARSISTWRKLNATDVLPARCRACGGFSFISFWGSALVVVLTELIFWGGILFALQLRSWLALLSWPLGLYLTIIIIGLFFDLKSIDSAQVAKARQRQKWLIFVLALYLLGVALLSIIFK